YLRFSCPFVQKRVFSYFSNKIFKRMGTLVEPFTDLDEVIRGDGLSIPHLVQLYRDYLQTNQPNQLRTPGCL
ncbi:MAG: hypothetical protein GY757_57790, partial [bacterium]|nr:hypothetical protein [bacterium]